MAYTDTANIPLHMPVPGSKEPAQIALLNENCVTLSNHDHTTGKALAIGRMRSGLAANRPAAGSAGNVYFSTDTGVFNADTGTAWVQFLTGGGQATVTGWTLVDPIVRDILSFGAKPTGTVDATITRTGAGALRVDTNLGVGMAPTAWGSPYVTTQVGVMALYGQPAAVGVGVRANSYYDGTNNLAIITGAATDVSLANGTFNVYTAPSVAAGAIQTMTQRIGLAQTGTLTLTPAAGATALIVPSLFSVAPVASTTDVQLGAAGAGAQMRIVATALVPFSDAFVGLGSSAIRWASVWASSGVVSGSSFDQKHDLSPLDPTACAQAVLDTDWISFVYNDPPQPEGEQYAEAYQKMLAETAPARHQNGYVLGSPYHKVSDLFGLSDRRSKNDGADLAVVACALQAALRRLAALEGQSGPS